MRAREQLFIAPGMWIYRISSADAPDVEYELAVFPDSHSYLNEIPQS